MGIPSYFSHIVKQHNIIIQKKKVDTIDNFYLDSNSIIYDVIHSNSGLNNNEIYELVCKKILYYASLVNPTNVLFIALDGVAPVAKLSQQRTRRIKTKLISNIENQLLNKNESKWDSTQITPGTPFMKGLNDYMRKYFGSVQMKCKIILSLSDVPGEGEHKLCHHIRSSTKYTETSVIYGLDADLIMLGLLHLKYNKSVYLFRETPHFIRQLKTDLNPDELYYLSMNDLSLRVAKDMLCTDETNTQDAINDYVFLCFILGNDFIPHHPGVNIRTNGIQIILDVYTTYMDNVPIEFTCKRIIDESNNINWKCFKLFLKYLVDEEQNYMEHEYTLRNKVEKRYIPNNTDDEKLQKLNMLPSTNRKVEHYIHSSDDNWQPKYYDTLFDVEYIDVRLQQICTNYLEALEWTWKYYTEKCYNWRWSYNYDYAPLFQNVISYIPYYNHSFMKEDDRKAIKDVTQLIYVLPKESHYLLPTTIQSKMNQYPQWFDNEKITFKWHYCKYLWESHITLPEMDIDYIEKHLSV